MKIRLGSSKPQHETNEREEKLVKEKQYVLVIHFKYHET